MSAPVAVAVALIGRPRLPVLVGVSEGWGEGIAA